MPKLFDVDMQSGDPLEALHEELALVSNVKITNTNGV